MSKPIKIPTMGESIQEAIISAILKPNGSLVKAEEEIIEIETEKVNQVLYAPQKGRLVLTVKVGDKVKVGDLIGSVEDSTEEASLEKPVKLQPSAPTPVLEIKPSGKPARVMADEFLKSASEEPIQKETPKADSSQRETRKKMSQIRKTIAKRLLEASQSTAMLTTFNELDMSAIQTIRQKYKDEFAKEHGVKLGFMSFFIKACVHAMKAFPEINAYIEGEDIVYRNYFDISVAVSTDRGLVVPVVRDADQLSFAQIEKRIGEFAEKAKKGALSLSDMIGGGFTISNGGIFGSVFSTPILNPPQSAILGMHRIVDRPTAVAGKVEIRPIMTLALSYDHRIVDGKEAASFLALVVKTLEDPTCLLIDL